MKYAEAKARLTGLGSVTNCPPPPCEGKQESQFAIEAGRMSAMLDELNQAVIELEKSLAGVLREDDSQPEPPSQPEPKLVPVAEVAHTWTSRVEGSVRKLRSIRNRVEA
jgi:hypothetical protein